jgi:hypothetical protein
LGYFASVTCHNMSQIYMTNPAIFGVNRLQLDALYPTCASMQILLCLANVDPIAVMV